MKTIETHQHRKIACLEEIAYLNDWISRDDVLPTWRDAVRRYLEEASL